MTSVKRKKRTMCVRPAWFGALKQRLGVSFNAKFPVCPATVRNKAISEILLGTDYCIGKGIKLSVTRSRTFNINSSCFCLLAKNTQNEYYQDALAEYHLTHGAASIRGFERSDQFDTVLVAYRRYHPSDDNDILWGDYNKAWATYYNHLWRQVGLFFKENSGFGVG